jgi:signal transduction histidine kinase/CheY-like chemotaxis protein
MRELKKFARDVYGAYRHHHESNPLLLDAIGLVGVVAFSVFYLVRLTGTLPERWDDVNFRLAAIVLSTLLALRRWWPRRLARWYLPYSYAAIFYCLGFFLPLTLLQNRGAANTAVNMVIGAVLIILLTDWRNTLSMLLGGYVASLAFYWAVNPEPRLPVEFLYWWIPMCAVLVAGGSISKYVEKRAELQRLRRVYSGAAGSIAHEMRTPLAQMQHSLEKIASLAAPGSPLACEVDAGRCAVLRGLQAISLTLQQVNDRPLDEEQFEELSAADCVRKALGEYAYEDAQQRDRVSVRVWQDFTFRGEETAFMLVLFNLLKNALYYAPLAPHVHITISVEADPVHRVVVHDNGPGIAPQLIGRLFEEFQTVGKSEGTGLGLAFCRRAMRAFGGDIECESETGRFTAFTLTFPRARRVVAIPAPPTRFEPVHTDVASDAALSGRRVLVVDDSALNRAIARARLSVLGSQVVEASHGAEALRMLHEGIPVDAVLMDMNMPGMNGVDATRALRALPGPAARIPVVLVTADPTLSARQAALVAGVDGFLVKPLEPDALRAELTGLLAPLVDAMSPSRCDVRRFPVLKSA